MIKRLLHLFSDKGTSMNYTNLPLVGNDELKFAKFITNKHLKSIFILSTSKLAEYYNTKRMLHDEDERFKTVVKKRKLESITAATQAGIDAVTKIETKEEVSELIDQRTKTNINLLERKLLKKLDTKLQKNSTGVRKRTSDKPGTGTIPSDGSSNKRRKTPKGKATTRKTTPLKGAQKLKVTKKKVQWRQNGDANTAGRRNGSKGGRGRK